MFRGNTVLQGRSVPFCPSQRVSRGGLSIAIIPRDVLILKGQISLFAVRHRGRRKRRQSTSSSWEMPRQFLRCWTRGHRVGQTGEDKIISSTLKHRTVTDHSILRISHGLSVPKPLRPSTPNTPNTPSTPQDPRTLRLQPFFKLSSFPIVILL